MGDHPTIYYCPGCGRVGKSSADLTRQGCEGSHVPYRPEAERDEARAERDRYRETLEELLTVLPAVYGDKPHPWPAIARTIALIRAALNGEDEWWINEGK